MPIRFFLLVAALLLAGCNHTAGIVRDGPALYQYSTLNALMAGNYEGRATVADLAAKGDFGLGTFNGLDGEMVVLNGVFYRADSALKLVRAPADARIPFADLTFFTPDSQAQTPALADLPALAAWLDTQLPSPRLFAAAKVQGVFQQLTIRSVPGFAPPYPGLGEAIKHQVVRVLTEIPGTLVAIRCPAETGGTTVPGWHFHFVGNDGVTGGHVLAAALHPSRAAWMSMKRLTLEMPEEGKAGTAEEIPGETVGAKK